MASPERESAPTGSSNLTASPSRSDTNASVFSSNGRVPKWPANCRKCGKKHQRPPKDWACVQCNSKVWQPDDDVEFCTACRTTKLSRGRRHHCRSCGNLVCDSCSKFTMCLPEWSNSSEKYRVCSNCALPSDERGQSGFLFKQGTRNVFGQEKFQRRWFQLRGTTLAYANKANAGFHGAINVTGAKVIDDPGHPHAFRILGPFLQRGYVLCAENDDTKAMWMRALDEAFAAQSGGDGSPFPTGANESGPRRDVSMSPDFSTTLAEYSHEQSVTAAISHFYSHANANTAALTKTLLATRDQRVSIAEFNFVRTLSRSKHSIVMLAQHRSTSAFVVVKAYDIDAVRTAPLHSKHSRQAIQTERAVLARMAAVQPRRRAAPAGAPYIVKMLHAMETKSHLFIVTEWSPGGDFLFQLRVASRFPEDRVRYYAAEIALSLAALHENRYVYGALQPEHVTLRADGTTSLTSFTTVGLRTSDDPNECVPLVAGALAVEYMPPESIDSRLVNVASDYWCLGVLMFELVAGVPPFHSDTGSVDEVISQIRTHPLDYPMFFSHELRQLLNRLLDREPNTRISTSAALLSEPFFRNVDLDAVQAMTHSPEVVLNRKYVMEFRFTDCSVESQVALKSYSTEVPPNAEAEYPGFAFPPPPTVAQPQPLIAGSPDAATIAH